MKTIILSSFLALLTACGGGSAPDPVATKRAINVVLLGDSVTRQAGQTLIKHLPTGSTVDNRGLDGARASDFLTGRYGNLPLPWNPEFVYIVSFGANECLGGQPVSDLVDATRGIVEHGRNAGAKNFVIEAPWRVLHGINQCNIRIAEFREQVIKLADTMGVPFAIEFDTESIGDAVHITQRHNEIRAVELEKAIFRLPTFLK